MLDCSYGPDKTPTNAGLPRVLTQALGENRSLRHVEKLRRQAMENSSPEQPRQSAPADVAVLLLNLGTPAAPTPRAVRRFLAEFLSDVRVIDYPRWLWLPLLYGVILRTRPRRSARAYAKIWTPQGSPLLVENRALAEKLAAACAGDGVRVVLAMRYGEPATADVVASLLTEGVRRLLVLPLYPQYSAASTAAAMDAVFAALQRQRWLPELRSIGDYHAAPQYISALGDSVEKYWNAHGRGARLLLSFHGIPERYVAAGDPYREQCMATARLLRERLNVDDHFLSVSFQSRVGRESWLAPYTDGVVARLAADGIRHVQVLCPGFAVDCLETLEEIAIRAREQFLGAGGERLDYIPALNDSDAHVHLLRSLIQTQTQGWLDGNAHAGA
jgi:protoporphyrin/coproporphyrin ferrochelatase